MLIKVTDRDPAILVQTRRIPNYKVGNDCGLNCFFNVYVFVHILLKLMEGL
jgi:hypothetical protein